VNVNEFLQERRLVLKGNEMHNTKLRIEFKMRLHSTLSFHWRLLLLLLLHEMITQQSSRRLDGTRQGTFTVEYSFFGTQNDEGCSGGSNLLLRCMDGSF
jgi:hypothetical protein